MPRDIIFQHVRLRASGDHGARVVHPGIDQADTPEQSLGHEVAIGFPGDIGQQIAEQHITGVGIGPCTARLEVERDASYTSEKSLARDWAIGLEPGQPFIVRHPPVWLNKALMGIAAKASGRPRA